MGEAFVRKRGIHMIYAVDFDDMIFLGHGNGAGTANVQLIKHLIFKRKMGDKIILWTCREGKRLQDAVDFCKEYGLVFDAVNDNLPEIIAKNGANSRKVICDVYLDGRAKSMDEYDFSGEVNMDKIKDALVRFADKVSVAG